MSSSNSTPATPESQNSSCSRNTQPFEYGASRTRKMPLVEQLVIPPYRPDRRSILATLWYKFNLETGLVTIEPWERLLSSITVLAIAGYSLYLWHGAYVWLFDVARAELAS